MIGRSTVQNSYNYKVKIGNWSEDQELKELQMREYLARKQKGNLLIHTVQTHMNQSLQRVGLTYSKDRQLRIGDHIMLYSVMTEGVLSVDVSQSPTSYTCEGFPVTSSTVTKSNVARNTFVVEGFGAGAKKGDVLRLGQEFRLRINPKLNEKPYYLKSQPVSHLSASKHSRRQEVTFSLSTSYDTAWRVEFKDFTRRFEMEGQPVPMNVEIIFVHCQTRQPLFSDKIKYYNDFGLEYEVCCHAMFEPKKKQQLLAEMKGSTTIDVPAKGDLKQNHWAILTATDPSLAALLEDGEGAPVTAETLVQRIRDQLMVRAKGNPKLVDLGRRFRIMDSDKSHKLSRREFQQALETIGVHFAEREWGLIYEFFDTNKDGSVCYTEFLTALRGPVPAARAALVDQAFGKMDRNGNGLIQLDDLRGVYSAAYHPDVKSGVKSEDEVLAEFLMNFEGINPDGTVTKEEFQDYYASVGAYIDDDEYFEHMMRTAWKL